MAKIVTRAKATVCGQPENGSLAISFELSSEQEDLKLIRGRLFGVLEIQDQSPEQNPLLGKKALEIIEQNYFQAGSSSNLLVLKETLTGLSDFLSGYLKDNRAFNGAFVVVWEDISYLATLGNGRVLIWRRSNLAPIIDGNQTVFLQTASGKIISDDLLVLQTQSFAKILDDQKIITSLDHRPVAEIAEGLLPEILKDSHSSGAAALFLQFNVEEKMEEEQRPTFQIPSAISRLLSKLPKSRRDLYLRHSAFEENKKTVKLIFTGLVFIFLLVAIIYQVRLQKTREATSEFGRVYSLAENQLESKQNLPQIKQSLIDYAVKKYGKDWSKRKDNEVQKIKALISRIDEAYLVTARIYKIETPTLFYDLSLLKDQAKSANAVLKDTNVIFIDSNSGTIFSLDTKTKNGTIVSGDEAFKGATLISARADWIYIFGNEGIYRVDTVKNKKELLIKKDEKFQEIISLISFTGNLYFLDKKANQIWKYIATETGFSDARTYLNPDVSPDFSKAVSMAIDGSVYVLKADGTILKFTQGLPENFTLTGLDGALNSPNQIITTDNYIYIHDKANRRIVLFNKKGEYYSQYQIGGSFDISQILADESSRKPFLISASKISVVDLK